MDSDDDDDLEELVPYLDATLPNLCSDGTLGETEIKNIIEDTFEFHYGRAQSIAVERIVHQHYKEYPREPVRLSNKWLMQKRLKALLGKLQKADGTYVPKMDTLKGKIVKRHSKKLTSLHLSEPLQDFLGQTVSNRSEIVSLVFKYIKDHNLLDPEDKHYVLCDEKMEGLFGKRVNMFTINKILSDHILPSVEEVHLATESSEGSDSNGDIQTGADSQSDSESGAEAESESGTEDEDEIDTNSYSSVSSLEESPNSISLSSDYVSEIDSDEIIETSSDNESVTSNVESVDDDDTYSSSISSDDEDLYNWI